MSHHQYVPLICLFLLGTFSLNGCTQSPSSESPNPTVEEKTTSATLPAKVPVTTVTKMQLNPTAIAVNAFATSLYAQLKSQPGNLFLSPYSISSILTMTCAGAKGPTKEQMATALHLGTNEPAIHHDLGELTRSLTTPSSPGYQLNIANAIWVQKRKVFLAAEFAELLHDAYQAGIKTADFEQAAETERQHINDWIARQTANKILELLVPGMLNAETQLVLTNAIYFKGKWQLPFAKEDTQAMLFLKLDGAEIKVPMMHQKATFNYLEDPDVQLLELPYQGSDQTLGLSMVILLPKKNDGLPAVETQLDHYLRSSSQTKPLEISVYLPKFKIAATFQLKEALQQLGMRMAFEPKQADFSGMTGKPELAISAVVHQAFAEVNEEGTEAAAATAVVGSRGRSLVFRADHPFVFWIRENRAGTVLFLGRVVAPRA